MSGRAILFGGAVLLVSYSITTASTITTPGVELSAAHIVAPLHLDLQSGSIAFVELPRAKTLGHLPHSIPAVRPERPHPPGYLRITRTLRSGGAHRA